MGWYANYFIYLTLKKPVNLDESVYNENTLLEMLDEDPHIHIKEFQNDYHKKIALIYYENKKNNLSDGSFDVWCGFDNMYVERLDDQQVRKIMKKNHDYFKYDNGVKLQISTQLKYGKFPSLQFICDLISLSFGDNVKYLFGDYQPDNQMDPDEISTVIIDNDKDDDAFELNFDTKFYGRSINQIII